MQREYSTGENSSIWVGVGKVVRLNAKGQATIAAISDDFQATTRYRVASGSDMQSPPFTVRLGAGKHTAVKLFKGAPRWKPCADAATKKPIVYQINVSKANNWSAAAADIDAAVGDIAAVTGLRFVKHETPTTTQFPQTGLPNFPTGVDMIIATGDATDSNILGRSKSKVLARGGFVTGSDGFIDRGMVIVDNRHELAGGAPVPGTLSWRMVLLHELAHALGVTHPKDDKQIMNPIISATVSSWGAGDLNALQAVGVRTPTNLVFGQTADACHAAS